MIKALIIFVIIWFWLAAFVVGVAALIWLPLVPAIFIGAMAASGWVLIFLNLTEDQIE